MKKINYVLYNGVKYVLPKKSEPVENAIKITSLRCNGTTYELPAPIYLDNPSEGESLVDILKQKLAEFDILDEKLEMSY